MVVDIAYEDEGNCCCVACDNCICDEFSRTSLNLEYPKPRDMVTCQWAWPEFIYLSWKIFGAVYFTVWIILSGVWEYDWAVTRDQRIKWFIYLTNWTFLLFVLQLIVQAVTACLYRVHVIDGDRMTPVLKIQWLLYSIATSSSFIICAAFWVLISTGNPHPVDIHSHGINCIYIFIDLFITAQPMRLLHFFHTEIYFIIYCLFSLFYHLAGGTNSQLKKYIYESLDWNEAGVAIIYVAAFMFILIPLMYFIQFTLFKLRLYIHRKLKKEVADIEMT